MTEPSQKGAKKSTLIAGVGGYQICFWHFLYFPKPATQSLFGERTFPALTSKEGLRKPWVSRSVSRTVITFYL